LGVCACVVEIEHKTAKATNAEKKKVLIETVGGSSLAVKYLLPKCYEENRRLREKSQAEKNGADGQSDAECNWKEMFHLDKVSDSHT